MLVEFLSNFQVEKLNGTWAMVVPLVVKLNKVKTVVVPTGFETDFASVPRLPLAYLLAGDTAHRSAVLHDYLYATQVGKKYADKIFLAAMKAEGISSWRRYLMYGAVKFFGSAAYTSHGNKSKEIKE